MAQRIIVLRILLRFAPPRCPAGFLVHVPGKLIRFFHVFLAACVSHTTEPPLYPVSRITQVSEREGLPHLLLKSPPSGAQSSAARWSDLSRGQVEVGNPSPIYQPPAVPGAGYLSFPFLISMIGFWTPFVARPEVHARNRCKVS